MNYSIKNGHAEAPIQAQGSKPNHRYDWLLARALVADNSFLPTISHNGESKYANFHVDDQGKPFVRFACDAKVETYEDIRAQIEMAQKAFSDRLSELMDRETEMRIISNARKETANG